MKDSVFIIHESSASLSQEKRLDLSDNRIELPFHINYEKNDRFSPDTIENEKLLLASFDDTPQISEFDKTRFLSNIKNHSIDVKTAQPNIGEYLEAYRRAAKLGATAILAVPMSRKLSGSIGSAESAVDLFMQERITKGYYEIPVKIAEYINSVSMVQGMKVLEAEELAKNGASIDIIKEVVESDTHTIHAIEIVSDLKQLREGGRITRSQHIVGGILGIIPILTIRDGKLESLDKNKVRGWENAIDHSLEYIYKQIGERAVRAAFVQFEAADDSASHLYNRAQRLLNIQEETISEQSYVLNAHTGIGVVGAAFQEIIEN